MSRDIISVGPDTPLGVVADLFRKHHFKTLPVIGEGSGSKVSSPKMIWSSAYALWACRQRMGLRAACARCSIRPTVRLRHVTS